MTGCAALVGIVCGVLMIAAAVLLLAIMLSGRMGAVWP